MFGPPKVSGKTTVLRYEQRKVLWRIYSNGGKRFRFPAIRHRLHWLFHNIPVHILIGLFPCKATFSLHDWSSNRLNAVHYYS
jgi:hypothetical protein